MGIIEPQAPSKSAADRADKGKTERLKDMAFSSKVRLVQCFDTAATHTQANACRIQSA
jgi:hypothetical protein